MKLATAKLLCEYSDELQLRESYSGRGMFGKETAGVVFDSFNDLLSAVYFLGKDFEYLLNARGTDNAGKLYDEELLSAQEDITSGFSYDSMGLQKIAY